MNNRIYILYLHFLYFGYFCFCFIFRPRVRGAYVLVTYKEKILLIKNSYKPGWTFPCGMVDRGETEIEGAKRELFEEVGINCSLSDLVFLKEVLSTKGFKKDHQFFYHLRLHDETEIVLDMREVIDFKWASVEDVLLQETPDSVRSIVSEYKAFIFN